MINGLCKSRASGKVFYEHVKSFTLILCICHNVEISQQALCRENINIDNEIFIYIFFCKFQGLFHSFEKAVDLSADSN